MLHNNTVKAGNVSWAYLNIYFEIDFFILYAALPPSSAPL